MGLVVYFFILFQGTSLVFVSVAKGSANASEDPIPKGVSLSLDAALVFCCLGFIISIAIMAKEWRDKMRSDAQRPVVIESSPSSSARADDDDSHLGEL